MATPYIKSYTGALRNRKVIALAKALRLNEIYALGHLHSLWYAVMEQQDDGDLTSWEDDMIAGSFGHSKDATELVRLLQRLGFLGYRHPDSKEILPGTERLVHDWIDYAGDYLRGRYSGKNKPKLITIWGKHGREYGVDPKSTESQPSLDHNKLTNHNQPPNHPKPAPRAAGGVGGRDKSEEHAALVANLEKRGKK